MPWLAKQNETQREREKEQETENYPSHDICLLVQASGSTAKSHGDQVPVHGSDFRLSV